VGGGAVHRTRSPSIDPVIFFKLQLVMFFEGIRSERKLIERASLNLAHRWYLGYALDEDLPDHSSLTRIRQRLGITPDAVRARLHRGTLVGEKRAGVWHVVFPLPPTEAGPTGTRQDATGTQQDANRPVADALIARLEAENAYLRQLLDAEIEARRRADHLVAGLVERLPALAEAGTAQDAAQRDEIRDMESPLMQPMWRRWGRRMMGAGSETG
jgi:hypothetical protein